MDSSSESEFRYDGGDVVGGGYGTLAAIMSIVVVLLIAVIVLLALSMTGVLSHKLATAMTPSAQIAYITANYSKAPTSGTATPGVCTMDADKSFKCTSPASEIDPTTGNAAAAEHLSVIWKDKMLSSGSDSAWGQSMHRSEGMCGQC